MKKIKYTEKLRNNPKTAPNIVKSATEKNGIYGSITDFEKNNVAIINDDVKANTI